MNKNQKVNGDQGEYPKSTAYFTILQLRLIKDMVRFLMKTVKQNLVIQGNEWYGKILGDCQEYLQNYLPHEIFGQDGKDLKGLLNILNVS